MAEKLSAKYPHLDISPEVADAVAAGKPVVALESTIITHGMPFPQNLEMAQTVEADIRAEGAVPATIAVMHGKMKAGVAGQDLMELAEQGFTAAKASRRDLAALLASKKLAGTTVATTMMIAQMAGIQIFATGGIGGVHRGAEDTFDISADLRELAKTPVGVVCAGAKSILDIPKTLEVLETNGVPVIGYGSEHFPAFYLRESGFGLDHAVENAQEAAAILQTQWSLGMGGVLIANPIPHDYAMDADYINSQIELAVADADAQGIKGKDATPFLLTKLFELTQGKSLTSNIALVRNNARVAARIAIALAALR